MSIKRLMCAVFVTLLVIALESLPVSFTEIKPHPAQPLRLFSSVSTLQIGFDKSPTLTVVPITNEDYVREAAHQYGWDYGNEWDILHTLISNESGFRNTAQNPTTSAYGMFQFLDSTWASYGCEKTSDPAIQSACGLKYLSRRYSSPSKALSFWYSNCPTSSGCWY